MSVWSDLMRGRVGRVGAALLATMALASCGGDQVDPFRPNRLVVFGDEASTLASDGTRYTVNPVISSTMNCLSYPIWVQHLAASFGFVFAECNPSAVATPTAFMRAQLGARAADLAGQVDAYLAAGNSFNNKSLVTVFAGANDIIYQSQQALTEAEMVANVEEAARQVAAQVNRIANADGRVLVLTVPNQGYTPYGRADTTRSTLLRKLTEAFNLALRDSNDGGIINDGRRIGLVDAWELVRVQVEFPQNFSPNLSDVQNAVCTDSSVGLGCTANTLVSGGGVTTWLWANITQLSPIGHQRLGELADTRARNNPF